MNRKLVLVLFVLFLGGKSFAQFNDYDPDYNWLTIKGEHVMVHYHEEAERSAKIVLKIADEVWNPITSLYQYEPDMVHYVIKDIDDYSNGATFFFDNKIEIWASALDFDLRGAHHWLRNVISHEFTHMVQIQAAMKAGRRVPAVYLQFLNYEDKRRPDILYGFPNFIASYPLASINIPAWFAEGTAQYMRTEFDYDNWDTHRDMILRSYVLDDNMLTWNEMGVFGKTSLGNESVYNSGFALTRYIAQKYGEDKLRKVTEALGDWNIFSIDAAFEKVIGKDGDELYGEWKAFLQEDYGKRMKSVLDNKLEGERIEKEGFGNFYPEYNNGKIYYLSNKGADYFMTSIYEYDPATEKSKMVLPGVRSTFDFIPNQNKIVYAKLSEDNPKWTNIHDLYIYDVDAEDSQRITFGLRANNPSVSPDGKKIAFIFQKDGTANIAIVDTEGKNKRELTFFNAGEQVYNPKFSKDGSKIIFDYSYHHGRDIGIVEVNGGAPEFILNESHDERNPVYLDEKNILYSSDETGIYNVYKMNLETGKKERLTNVTGGAFMPDVNERGDIVYAAYSSTGYKINELKSEKSSDVNPAHQYVWLKNPPLEQKKPNGDIDNFNINVLTNFEDKTTPDYEPQPYKGQFTDVTFFPFIRYDNYNTSNSGLDKIKPGVYVASNDILNRYGFFAGGAINKRLERDLFLTFEYRHRLPVLYDLGIKPEVALELYSVSRSTEADLEFDTLDASQTVTTDVTYNLFEVDFVAKHKIFASGNELEFRFIYSKYSSTLESFIIPLTEQLYPTTSDDYLIGKNFQLKFTHKNFFPNVDADINPKGREVEFQYNYEMNDFNPSYEYDEDSGQLLQTFEEYKFHKLELNYKEYMPLWKDHTLTFQFRGATILGPPVDDFFDFYLGGLIGMKAYPFYAVSGNELGWMNLSYRFPLLRNIDKRFGWLYIDKIFMSVFADYGNAWTGEFPDFSDFKKGAGAEVRIKMNSFYLFPTSIFFSAAYSFDEFDRYIEIFRETATYGKEWRFYGGVLFDFAF
ncbi:MAG: hypothetical protein SCALA702_03320 [Melioribacteraceae bacterium]|nr:MAG: hypothetical protein SCALA702_03320 [Melioribacteraceae bacterium]